MKLNQEEELTAKEIEMLKMFSVGMLRVEVMSKLVIGDKTLRIYLGRIYKKIGVKQLHQAVVWYFIKFYNLAEKA
jgi:DNA-binding CsgD family transcriptional regulator